MHDPFFSKAWTEFIMLTNQDLIFSHHNDQEYQENQRQILPISSEELTSTEVIKPCFVKLIKLININVNMNNEPDHTQQKDKKIESIALKLNSETATMLQGTEKIKIKATKPNQFTIGICLRDK